MKTLVFCRLGWLERTWARALGPEVVAASVLAATCDEASLRAFPPAAWCESQEANLKVLERVTDISWRSRLSRFARAEKLDRDRLEQLIAQTFLLTWGRRLAALRVSLALLGGPVRLVSDLPAPLARAVLAEFGDQVSLGRVGSWPLRAVRAVHDLAYLVGRHLVRAGRLLRLMRLPRGVGGHYYAWLGALHEEVAHTGSAKLSLLGFLAEARQGAGLPDVVVQGAAPSASLDGFIHRAHVPPLRFRPSWAAVVKAVACHFRRLALDAARCFDFRDVTLLATATRDVTAFRLWFESDPPRGVLYPNHAIGSEPPVSLLGSVPSTMVFYSANVSHFFPPREMMAPGMLLEPEMRFVIADRLTMWSSEMTGAFAAAGHEAQRLVETGPVVFGRQEGFIPPSRSFAVQSTRPVRVGVFDVSVLNPSRRANLGIGLTIYNADIARRFFSDIFTAAHRVFRGDAVIVRKAKRARARYHMADPDFTLMPPLRIEAREPDESLWRVLESIDLVLCMPFTSVAYLADECGIPAAYYDPGLGVARSPLTGRAPLLSGLEQLERWLRSPVRPERRIPAQIAPLVFTAANRCERVQERSHISRRINELVLSS